MAVSDKNSIDHMEIASNKDTLKLFLTDDLDWELEHEHLLALQDKLNAYIGFIETNQYEEIYPQHTFKHFLIEIHFEKKLIQPCLLFLDAVVKELENTPIRIQVELDY